MPAFWAALICLKLLFLVLVQDCECQDLPETWSYPESTANGWDGLCATGTRQSPIELYSDELPKPNIHSNIKFNNYFSENSRNTFGYFKNLRGILENDGTKVQWTIGADLKHPFKRCLDNQKNPKYHRGCPNISGGPFTDSKRKCEKYFLWKIAFRFGAVNETHSEHTIEGKPYDMEMQMIHVNMKYINAKDGSFREAEARNNTDFEGFAIISFMFERHDSRGYGYMSPLDKINEVIDYGNVDDPASFRRGRKGRKGRRQGRKQTKYSRVKRSLEDSLAFLDDNEHLEEMDKLSDTLRSMKQEKDNGITKRNVDLCDSSSTCSKVLLNPGKFIKKGTAKAYHPAYNKHYFATYFTYHGSLTTPGCEEAVTWAVFARPLPVESAQVWSFQELYTDNFRQYNGTQQLLHLQNYSDVQHLIHDDQRRFRPISKKTLKKAAKGKMIG